MTVPAFLSLEEARERYQLGRTALADRMRHCQITTTRSGNRSFIDAAQIHVLDQLDRHLTGGRGLTDFHSPYVKVEVDEPATTAIVSARDARPLTVETPNIDVLAELERLLSFLDRASASGWKLPTSVVRHLLGATPRGSEWRRFGFTFKPSGHHGQETAWLIMKDG